MTADMMASMRSAPRVMAAAAWAGTRDYIVLHRWGPYLLGWIVRLAFQVIFFTLISKLIGADQKDYLLVGNAAGVAGIEGTMVVADLTSEVRAGTLQALLTTPADVSIALLARTVHWVGNGVFTGCLVFAVVIPLFGLPLTAAQIVALPLLLVVCAASAWAFGCLIAVCMMWRPSFNWLMLNLSYLTLLTFCGVNVPIGYWAWPVRIVARAIPFSWALAGLRDALSVTPSPSRVLGGCLVAIAVAIAWLVASNLILRRQLAGSRELGIPSA